MMRWPITQVQSHRGTGRCNKILVKVEEQMLTRSRKSSTGVAQVEMIHSTMMRQNRLSSLGSISLISGRRINTYRQRLEAGNMLEEDRPRIQLDQIIRARTSCCSRYSYQHNRQLQICSNPCIKASWNSKGAGQKSSRPSTQAVTRDEPQRLLPQTV